MSDKEDGRKSNGGKRTGAGRPPKADKLVKLTIAVSPDQAGLFQAVKAATGKTDREILMAGVAYLALQ